MNNTSRRTSAGDHSPRLHKNDDARQAAKVKSKDFEPLIRIVDTGIQKASLDKQPRLLYLKHEPKRLKPFLTTDYDTPLQHPNEMGSEQWQTQHMAATQLIGVRGEFWKAELPDKPRVQAAATKLITRCERPDIQSSGSTCDPSLRNLLQDLHDALHSHAPSTDAVKERKESSGKKGLPWSVRRSHTQHPPAPDGQASGQTTSSGHHPPGSAPSPRLLAVSFAAEEASTYLPASPRKSGSRPTSTQTTPRTVTTGLSPSPSPSDGPAPPSSPPTRPLPPLPIGALPTHGQPVTVSPKSPKSPARTPDALEKNRPYPKPMLQLSAAPRSPLQQNTPGTTPRDKDEH